MAVHVARLVLVTFSFLVLLGCGGAATTGEKGKVGPGGKGKEVSAEVRADFQKAVESFNAAKKLGLSKDKCQELAEEFDDISSQGGGFAPAMLNKAIILNKCRMKDESKKAIKEVLRIDPKNQSAMTFQGAFAYEEGDVNSAMNRFKDAIKIQPNALEAVPAYVNLAAIERRQGDYKKAQSNLRRALAIEANFMPAFFQLAMLYYEIGVKSSKKSFYELAQLVCSQAAQVDPTYAPIYNVWGLIKLKKNEIVAAAQKFKQAIENDAEFYEAYMNFGGITLNFRGYEDAKMAFENAIRINPKDYEASVGLAVAYRGLGQYDQAKKYYEEAKKINSSRSDVYFNLGVLEMDYTGQGDEKSYKGAIKIFEEFLDHVSENDKKDPDGKGPMLSWEDKAKKRIETCTNNIKMLREAEEAMREMEQMKKEMEERKKKEEEERVKMLAEVKKMEEGETPQSSEAKDDKAQEPESQDQDKGKAPDKAENQEKDKQQDKEKGATAEPGKEEAKK